MSKDISIGTSVAYTAAFCRSIGAFTGPLPFARGEVVDVKRYDDATTPLWRVDWGEELGTNWVLESNIIRADRIYQELP